MSNTKASEQSTTQGDETPSFNTLCSRSGKLRCDVVSRMVSTANTLGLGGNFAYEAVAAAIAYLDATHQPPTHNTNHVGFGKTVEDVDAETLTQWLDDAPVQHLGLCDEAQELRDIYFGIDTSEYSVTDHIRTGHRYAYELAMEAVIGNWPEA